MLTAPKARKKGDLVIQYYRLKSVPSPTGPLNKIPGFPDSLLLPANQNEAKSTSWLSHIIGRIQQTHKGITLLLEFTHVNSWEELHSISTDSILKTALHVAMQNTLLLETRSQAQRCQIHKDWCTGVCTEVLAGNPWVHNQ